MGQKQNVASATYNCALGSALVERRDHSPNADALARYKFVPVLPGINRGLSSHHSTDITGDCIPMKKPTSKIREELARLQEQLKQAETRDAERIGRIALKAGLGEIEIDDADLQAAFEDVAKRFRGTKAGSNGKEKSAAGATGTLPATSLSAGAVAGQAGEA